MENCLPPPGLALLGFLVLLPMTMPWGQLGEDGWLWGTHCVACLAPLQALCSITSSCATEGAALCTPGSLPWICVGSASSTLSVSRAWGGGRGA